MNVVVPLLLGIGFGWALQRGGLTEYARVANVYRFSDLTVVKFLLTALVVGAWSVRTLVALGLATDALPISPTYVLGNALGGVMLGVGMALSGFCPGTVVAGAAEGRLDYAIPGIAGVFAGALAFGWSYPRFFPRIARVAALGRITFPSALHVDAWLVLVLLTEIVVLVVYAMERLPKRVRH